MAFTRPLRVISSAALAGALTFISTPTASADVVRDGQWALKNLDAEEIWNVTKGSGQTVAVIDSGVMANHVDLHENVLPGKDFIDEDSSAQPDPGESHGTGMASIIAGHGHGPSNSSGVKGLAPAAKILPLKDDGSAPTGFAESIRYAVDNGADVINISKGNAEEPASEEQAAVAYALEHDVPVVASAGNDGGPVEYPAAMDGMVAVGGTGSDGKLWESSSRGPETLLTAPAQEIVHAGTKTPSSYLKSNGTSDAAAYTSGALALLRAEFAELSAGQLVNRLTQTAKLPESMQRPKLPDEEYGYGTIQPLAALTEDIPKGSKYGPLTAPKVKGDGSKIVPDEPTQAEIDAENAESEREAKIIWAVLGVIGVVFVGLVVLIVVLVRKKKKRNSGPGGANWPGGPGAPGMPGASGSVQPQQGMPPVPPQQPGEHPAPPYQPPRS